MIALRRGRGRCLGASLAALLVALSLPVPALGATPTFQQPTADFTYGTEIVFRQTFDSPAALARVEILLQFPGSLGPFVAQVASATPTGSRDLTFRWSISADGFLTPNTPITARWRLVPADGSAPSIGPSVHLVYADTSHDWKTVEDGVVRVHWYTGNAGFGRQVLALGQKAVGDAADFLGVTETEPVDFFVYPDQAGLYSALGPGTRENVGAEQISDIRTIFAWIAPGDSTASVYVSHELTHLVFNTAVQNPYHSPPRWLNEGVAVYLSEGYVASDRSQVEAAAPTGRLMPLVALAGLFPTSADRFYLAYAESVSAVDFLVRHYGKDALVRLIRSYAGGVSDDEAFKAGVGTDVAGFQAAWLADLGAKAPVQYGPQAAPSGPVPPGWQAGASPATTSAPTTGPSGAASPAPSSEAGATPIPGQAGEGSPSGGLTLIAVAALAGLAIGVGIGIARSRRASPPPESPPGAPPPQP